MLPRLLLGAGCLAVLGGCGRGQHPAERPEVFLVDSLISESEFGPDAAVVHRVEVRFGVFTDTIPDVQSATLPVVTPDGEVTGIAWDEGLPVRGFFYDPGTGRLQFAPLPEYLLAYALAPDGLHIAYTTVREAGVVAVVRRWPSGDVVAEGSPAGGYPSDVVYDNVEWLENDRVRISQRLDHMRMRMGMDYRTGLYQRTSVALRRRSVSTDTVQVGVN